jgi:hypothetical protein
MNLDNSIISMIKSQKNHVFFQSCPLSYTCKLLWVGQTSWRLDLTHICRPENPVQGSQYFHKMKNVDYVVN